MLGIWDVGDAVRWDGGYRRHWDAGNVEKLEGGCRDAEEIWMLGF